MFMLEVEAVLPPRARLARLERVVEASIAAEDLTITLKGTLAKYPGCVHWHCKQGTARGTLEITWWPPKRRLWFKVSAGRGGDWVERVMPRLQQALERKLLQVGSSSPSARRSPSKTQRPLRSPR